MTAPTIASASSGNDSSATGSRSVTLPASHAAGDLLVINFGTPSSTITTPAGWSRLETTDTQWAVFYIIDTGSLGSTVTISTGAFTRCAWTVFKVNAGTYDTSVIAKGTLATGNSLYPNPPSCSSGYTVDTAYVALFKSPINNAATAYPINYSASQATAASGSSTYKVSVGQAVRTVNGSASDDPGTFTTGSISGAWSAQTIALVPAGTNVISGTAASTFKMAEAATGRHVVSGVATVVAAKGSVGDIILTTSNTAVPLVPCLSGDLLALVVSTNANNTINTPTGWAFVASGGSGNNYIWVFKRLADGSEGSTVNLSLTSGSQHASAISVAIVNASDTALDSAHVGFTVGASGQPDPPSLSAQGGLWLAIGEQYGGTPSYPTTPPTNYTMAATANEAWAGSAIAWRTLTASSEDPGAFSGGGSAAWASATVAISGLAATGTAASTFKFSESATGSQSDITYGPAASTFKFSEGASGNTVPRGDVGHLGNQENDTTATSTVISCSGTLAVGDTVVVGWGCPGNAAATGATDNLGNTYVVGHHVESGNASAAVLYANVTKPGSVTTITVTHASATRQYALAEQYRGLGTKYGTMGGVTGTTSSSNGTQSSAIPAGGVAIDFIVTENRYVILTAGADSGSPSVSTAVDYTVPFATIGGALAHGFDAGAGTTGYTGTFSVSATNANFAAVGVVFNPLAFTGTGGSSFKFSEAASGSANNGTGGSTFKFSEAASGTVVSGATGTGASTFGFSESASGSANSGTASSLWKFSESADGEQTYPPVTGTGSATWKFSEGASGGALSGAGDSSWRFSQSATGEQTYPAVTGTSDVAFGWLPAGSGGDFETVAGTSDVAFGFAESADGEQTYPPVTGTGASAWEWAESADGLTFISVTGTGASGWKWSGAATAAESMTGTSAVAWKWRDYSFGLSSEPVTGTAHSTFKFAESAGGWEDPSATGTAASGPWKFGEAATGVEHAKGTAASTFRFAETASGWTDVTGTSASTWKFATTVVAIEASGTDIIGESHLTAFGWGDEVWRLEGAEGFMTQRPADTTWVTVA